MKLAAISIMIFVAVAVLIWQEVRLRRLGAENSQFRRMPGAKVLIGFTPQRHSPKTATNAILAAALAKPFDWRLVESDDYRKYIANLRAIGCPEETLRDIITADVEKLFASRAKEIIKASPKRHEYWKSNKAEPYDEDTIRKVKELTKDRQAVFKELLGVDVPDNLNVLLLQNLRERKLAFLAPEKLQQVVDIDSDTDRWQRSQEALRNHDYKEAARISAEQEAALNQVLTPEEKSEYDLRESGAADMLRIGFGGFEPTEQEFREMFRLWNRYRDGLNLGRAALEAPDISERRQTAKKEFNDELRSLLGEERYREYAFEHEWSVTGNLASQFGIPKDTWKQVFDVKMAAQEQTDMLRGTPSLTSAQRQVALDGIRAATERAVGSVIGKDLLPGYLRLASWIREINQSSGTSQHP